MAARGTVTATSSLLAAAGSLQHRRSACTPAAAAAAPQRRATLQQRLLHPSSGRCTIGSRTMRRRTATVQGALKDGTRQAADSAEQTGKGVIQELAGARRRLIDRGTPPGEVALLCGAVGVTLGFLFQITHNVGYLPVYDVWAFNLGPFPEAWTIPLLLAPIWLLYGYVAPILDEAYGGAAVKRINYDASNTAFVVLTWAALAAQFLFSDLVYQTGQPHWLCHATLAPLAAAIWKTFDGTKNGALLAALLTVGAPAGEMLIVNFLGLWHYERPDLLGVPTWAGWCYATYAIGVANVARNIVARKKRSRA